MKYFILTVFALSTLFAHAQAQDMQNDIQTIEEIDTPAEPVSEQPPLPTLKEENILLRHAEGVTYSQVISIPLSNINAKLADGISGTRFYSETNTDINVIHKIIGDRLLFIIPTETELQKDFTPDAKYTYTYIPSDSSKTCFKYLVWGGDSNNPVRQNVQEKNTWTSYGVCGYHPFILEGVLANGELFKLNYLLATATSAQPRNYSMSTATPASVGIGESANYAVVTDNEPLKIKIFDDWSAVQNISTTASSAGKSQNVTSKLTLNEDTKEYELALESLNTRTPGSINLYADVLYPSVDGATTTKRNAGYYINFFPGVCTATGTVAGYTDSSENNTYAMLTCTAKLNNRTVNVSQRTLVSPDGSFSFSSVPQTTCSAKTWNTKDTAATPAKISVTCK